MNRILILLTRLLLILLFPGFLFAQQKPDYTLLLSSGKIVPAENLKTLSKSATVLTSSKFEDKYYVVLQFNSLPDQSVKNKMMAMGIELVDYIPNLAYTAAVPVGFDLNNFKQLPVRSVFNFTPQQKSTTALLQGQVPAHAIKQSGFADLSVISYEKISAEKINTALKNIGAIVLEDYPVFRNFIIRVPLAAISKLVALSFVQWAEPIEPPHTTNNLPGRTLHRANILNDGVRNLKGNGINVGIWDEGRPNMQHLDFSPTGRVTVVRAPTTSDHTTHVSGILAGKGLVDPFARGMAPEAKIFSWDFNTNIPAEMATAIPNNNLLVSNHSYGNEGTSNCTLNDPFLVYSTTARNTDLNLNNFTSHLHVHSAGNDALDGSCSGGFYTITGSGKAAKNNLVVGNITSTETIASSSSRGPVQDGRIKPEICAMGSSVFSTWTPNNAYATVSGTSMSTPGVSGTAALLYQRYKELNGNMLPPSALIKNIICNGAADLGTIGPDYIYGFGRINALSAVKILEENRYVINTVANTLSNDITIAIPAGAARLSVMLTWNDPAAAANVNPTLVNNLDLSVINGLTTTLPWILDKDNPILIATKGVDNYSNIEQVTIDNPAAGTYTLKVNGTAITVGASQQYVLTWIIDPPYIEVTYPNGNEKFSPGTSQIITWDNAGINTSQKLEYSLDNGANWIVISNAVASNVTRFAWTVPAANTSMAIIRISSGAITDVSDIPFHILGRPAGLQIGANGCVGGEVNFTWTAVTNATHYDLYKLNKTTGNFELFAANISGTSYTATGLTEGSSEWFALVAKNNTTGAVSERSNAINATVSTTGGGNFPIGNISGPTLICGAPQNVSYTVPALSNAVSYTWTTVPGSTIASGQGTNTIFVNFSAGSTSGNITVFAVLSNGCSTNTTSFPVTISPLPTVTLSASPYTKLFPGLSTTLTATVNPPGTYTYTWFKNAVQIAATGNTLTIGAGDIGNYSVIATNVAGPSCSNSSNVAEIGDSASTRLFIYPNPNKGQFQVNYFATGASAFSISIYDTKGSLQYRKKFTLSIPYQRMDVDMRQNGKGIYLVVLHDNGGNKLAEGKVLIQ